MIRLLTEKEQMVIEIELKKLGIVSKMTDFAKLIGGPKWEDERESEYWLLGGKTNYSLKNMVIPHENTRNIGYRFVMDADESIFGVKNKKQLSDDIFEIEFGEYPTTIIPDLLQKEILRYDLEETGKYYHINGRKVSDLQSDFLSKTLIECRYQDYKFVELKPNILGRNVLINGERISDRRNLFFEVLPIQWLFFAKLGILVTKDIVLSGIKYEEIQNFVRVFLEHEILCNTSTESLEKQKVQTIEKRLEEIQTQRKQLLSEEEILRNELSLFKAKSFEEMQNEINEEYKHEFGIEKLEFEKLLQELYSFHVKNKMKRGKLSVLERLLVTLRAENGVSFKALAQEYGLNESTISYNIKLTKEILKDFHRQ